jgi:hypothetical protein
MIGTVTKDDDIFAVTAQRSADGNIVLRRGMSLKEAREQTKRHHERMEERTWPRRSRSIPPT